MIAILKANLIIIITYLTTEDIIFKFGTQGYLRLLISTVTNSTILEQTVSQLTENVTN